MSSIYISNIRKRDRGFIVLVLSQYLLTSTEGYAQMTWKTSYTQPKKADHFFSLSSLVIQVENM